MGFLIRKALPEDAFDYAVCHVSSWQSAYKNIIPDEYLLNMSAQIEQRAERFKQELIEQHSHYYIPVFNDKAIGKLIISKSRDKDKPDAGEIVAIYLIEAFWGKGYGHEMIDFAIDKLRIMGYCETIIWVLEDNIRARRFYEKCGFVYDGTKKHIEVGKPLVEVRYILTQ